MKPYKTTTNIKPSMDWENEILTLDIEIDGLVKHHYKEVVDFKEKTVRKVLISLGWTPPEGKSGI